MDKSKFSCSLNRWNPSIVFLSCRGLHGETLMVDDQHHVVRGWKGKLKNAQRWAAMRLLMELGHQIDPAFFKDTPEGVLCCTICVI